MPDSSSKLSMFILAMFGVLGVPIRLINKMDSNIGFEISLIVVDAIRGRCASFTVRTATVWEIFGGQTNSSIFSITVKAEVRKAVRTFEKMIAMEAKKNPKAFFNYARSNMKTRTRISDLEYPDGPMAHTDVEKAELLNAFSQTYSQKKTWPQYLRSSREHTESHSHTSPSTTTWSQQFWVD